MNWMHEHALITFGVSAVLTFILVNTLEYYCRPRNGRILLPPEFDTRNYRGVAIVEPRTHGAFFER